MRASCRRARQWLPTGATDGFHPGRLGGGRSPRAVSAAASVSFRQARKRLPTGAVDGMRMEFGRAGSGCGFKSAPVGGPPPGRLRRDAGASPALFRMRCRFSRERWSTNRRAVEMVDLVLDAGSEQTLGLDLAGSPVTVGGGSPGSFRPVFTTSKTSGTERHPSSTSISPSVHRISGSTRQSCPLRSFDRSMVTRHASRHRPGSREADPGGVVHRLEHVVDQPPDTVVDRTDGFGAPAQARIGVVEYLESAIPGFSALVEAMLRKCAPPRQPHVCLAIEGGRRVWPVADAGRDAGRMVEAPGVTLAISTRREGGGDHRADSVSPVAA